MSIEWRDYTPARVALSSRGSAWSTADLLRFQLDHARARDAVSSELDPLSLPFPNITLASEARDRKTFLLRPDLGRRLAAASRSLLSPGPFDLVVVVADGLSAKAVEQQAAPLLDALLPRLEQKGWRLAPTYTVRQARVAIGDDIGQAVEAKLSLVLIGERPGLSSPDSLGAYLTWGPRPGRTDAERNCISNIRPEGLTPPAAAELLLLLLDRANSLRLTGIGLKGDENLLGP